MNQKKTISKIYNSKVFWIVISLLCSFVMWAYITSPDTGDFQKTFRGVQVEFAGQEKMLSDRSLSISDVDTQSVTVTLRGSRSNIGKLRASDIKAVIDVSNIKQPNDMTWAYELQYPDGIDTSDITVINKNPETINFTVVKNATKTVGIKGSFEGEIAEGCVAEEFVFEPSTIVIEGPEETLAKIDHAWVTFGEGTIDSTYSEEVGYKLMTADGQEVSTTGLVLSAKVITATQPLLKTKEVPLTANLIPGGGVDADDCTVTIEPKTLKIAGDTRLVDDINSIVLGSIDLASFQSSYTHTFAITLADEVQNLTGVTEAKVTVEVRGTHTKSFTTDNISCKNVTSGYSAKIDTESIDVTLRSKDTASLDKIRPDDISVVVDLKDYGATTGQVIATGTVYISRVDGVGAVGDIRVSVTITKD